jgi:DNA-binding beta-propeller fold protein YncE
VQKFDNNGKFLMKWGRAGQGDGEFSHATGVAVDARGNIFVADYENKRVQKFNSLGESIVKWNMGSDSKIIGTPEAIFVDEQGQVYVTDYQFGRVEVFTNDGELLQTWGRKSLADALFKRPTGIALDHDGRVYVVNQSGDSVQVFNLP